jgi:hypothetical protein
MKANLKDLASRRKPLHGSSRLHLLGSRVIRSTVPTVRPSHNDTIFRNSSWILSANANSCHIAWTDNSKTLADIL